MAHKTKQWRSFTAENHYYIKTFVSRVQFHRNTSVTVLVCALLPVLEYDTEDQDQDCHVDEIAASVGRN